MSTPQFIHLEVYARKAGARKAGNNSIFTILDEAARTPSACPHISHPKPPKLLFGKDLTEVRRASILWASQARDAKGRRLRIDGLCLLAGVVSLSKDRSSDWQEFRDATIRWLRKYFGPHLVCVIEHLDEANPHLHFYCIPAAGERFNAIHPGRRAMASAASQGKVKGLQNRAYKEAMRRFQDEFSEDVALGFGITRVGPRRRRMTRAEYMQEQAMARVYAAAREALKQAPQAIAPAAIRMDNLDWRPVNQILNAGKRRLFGEDIYTREQVIAAAKAIVKSLVETIRKDESQRWEKVKMAALGAQVLEEKNKILRAEIHQLRLQASDLRLFSTEEIKARKSAHASFQHATKKAPPPAKHEETPPEEKHVPLPVPIAPLPLNYSREAELREIKSDAAEPEKSESTERATTLEDPSF